jgi:hypothetical protein
MLTNNANCTRAEFVNVVCRIKYNGGRWRGGGEGGSDAERCAREKLKDTFSFKRSQKIISLINQQGVLITGSSHSCDSPTVVQYVLRHAECAGEQTAKTSCAMTAQEENSPRLVCKCLQSPMPAPHGMPPEPPLNMPPELKKLLELPAPRSFVKDRSPDES